MSSEGSKDESEDFKRRDGHSYDAVTHLFDLFTTRYTQPIANRMVDLAHLGPRSEVLDVGTGTAPIALEAGRRIAEGGRVLGIDISAGMLASATAKANAAGLSGRVHFEHGDAEALTCPTAPSTAY